MCRKMIEAIDKKDLKINIWGNGEQTRSFMYIDDCVKGIDMITHCDDLIATPINLGSSELVSINTLVGKVEKIAGVKLKRSYKLDAPLGVVYSAGGASMSGSTCVNRSSSNLSVRSCGR